MATCHRCGKELSEVEFDTHDCETEDSLERLWLIVTQHEKRIKEIESKLKNEGIEMMICPVHKTKMSGNVLAGYWCYKCIEVKSKNKLGGHENE